MKRSLILALTFFTSLATADFLDATEAYQAKDHQKAFKQFETLAKLGNHRAQFNLAVMYLNGEGVTKDLTQAYAWGKLASESGEPEFAQVSERVLQSTPKNKQEQLKNAADQLFQSYGTEAIQAQLAPISLIEQPDLKAVKMHINNRVAPKYPLPALKAGKQGWATVLLDIYPDGSVRNVSIIEAFPDDTFNEASIEAVKSFTFSLESDQPITHVIQARQTIEFQIQTRRGENNLKATYKERLDQLQSLAEKNHPQAQYLYAMAGNANLLHAQDRLSDEEVNDWLLHSAQNGYIDAQYMLGKNILYGKGCQANNEKGFKWLLLAAESGHDKASRELYQLQKRGQAQSKTPTHFWLKQSAESGNPESELEYANYLLTDESKTSKSLATAEMYLKQYTKNRKKGVRWYQIAAKLENQKGNEKKAQKYSQKAEKLAEKLGWDLSIAME